MGRLRTTPLARAARTGIDQPDRWQRVDLVYWLVVAILSVSAFLALTVFANAPRLVTFLGVLVGLDLPICLYVIWRAARYDDAHGRSSAS